MLLRTPSFQAPTFARPGSQNSPGKTRWNVILAGAGSLAVMAGAVVVWAAATSSLRFSHKTHYDQNVRCERCHVDSGEPASRGPTPPGWMPLEPSRILRDAHPRIIIEGDQSFELDLPGPEPFNGEAASGSPAATQTASLTPTFGRPPEKTCLECHPRQRNRKECGLCHLGVPAPTERVRRRLPTWVKFPHDAHKTSDCLDCHPRVTAWETLDGTMQDLTMTGCLKCHTGVKVKKTCTLCHDPTPHPADHVRNFADKHGLAYRADPQRCRTCHEDSSCIACHAQRPRSHTLAWVSRRHGLTASTRPESCKACHSDPGVCLRCH